MACSVAIYLSNVCWRFKSTQPSSPPDLIALLHLVPYDTIPMFGKPVEGSQIILLCLIGKLPLCYSLLFGMRRTHHLNRPVELFLPPFQFKQLLCKLL